MSDVPETTSDPELARLQRIRGLLKKKQPPFRRVESWRYKRVKESWRKARGIDSRTRKKRKGWTVSPSPGYRTPKRVRYASPTGKQEILISSVAELSLIDSQNQIGRIARKVGRRKKENIITEAELLNIHIVNPIVAKVDLGDLEEELALDEAELEDIELEDLELDDLDLEGDDEEE